MKKVVKRIVLGIAILLGVIVVGMTVLIKLGKIQLKLPMNKKEVVFPCIQING